MANICALITGGTIGMITKDNSSLMPNHPLDYNKLFPHLADLAEIDYHLLFYLDSSSVGAPQWREISLAIEKRLNKYDGFVVCHGTDTMAYSASALAYAFGSNLNHPIVFTGCQRTPDSPDSDAEANLVAAIKLSSSELAEVVIAFDNLAWRACRTIKVSNSQKAAFTSPNTPPLAQLDTKCPLTLTTAARRQSPQQKTGKPISDFSDQLALFYAIPSHDPTCLIQQAKSGDWQVGLVVGLGNGNLPPRFLSFLQAAKEHNKQIIITSASSDPSPISYPPLREALEQGAIYAGSYSLPGLWTKLCWLAPQSEKLQSNQRQAFFKEALAKSYVGELEVES